MFSLVVAIIVVDLLALFAQWHSDASHESSSHLSRFMFKVAICFDIIAAFCYIAHFNTYSDTGKGNNDAFIAGDVFWIFGELTMITLLLALAKGWTIYRPTLRQESVIKMAVFLFAYTVTHIVVLIVERTQFSRETITFRYDSNAGTAMCCIYFFGWGWFSWYIYVTLKPMIHGNRGGAGLNENNQDLNNSYQRAMAMLGSEQSCPQEKYKFFQAFWVLYTIWFLMWPIAIFALIDSAPAFTRLNSAWVVRLARHTLGLLVLLVLWWPSVRNIFFPFERSATTIAQTPHKSKDDGNEEAAHTTAADVVARRNIFSSDEPMTAGSNTTSTLPKQSGHTEEEMQATNTYAGMNVDDSSSGYLAVNPSPEPQATGSPSPEGFKAAPLTEPVYNNKLPPIQDFRQANV